MGKEESHMGRYDNKVKQNTTGITSMNAKEARGCGIFSCKNTCTFGCKGTSTTSTRPSALESSK